MSEVAEIPDLNEFDGMSVKDIAFTITLSEEGSEDQLRAIEAIRRRAPGIGHNRPPLNERLDEEFAALAGRAAAVMQVAETVAIVDDESAGKVSDLLQQMTTLEGDVDTLRKKLIAPYADAVSLINARASAIKDPVVLARGGGPTHKGRAGLRGLLTAYDDKRRAKVAAAQEAAREEQRQREAEAEAARKRAEEAAAAGKSSVLADLAAQDAAAEAERAAKRAEALRPEPIRANLGQTTRSRVIKHEVTDVRVALGWALKQSGLRVQLVELLTTMIGRYLRSLGVETVEKGVDIPGVKASIELGAVNVRR